MVSVENEVSSDSDTNNSKRQSKTSGVSSKVGPNAVVQKNILHAASLSAKKDFLSKMLQKSDRIKDLATLNFKNNVTPKSSSNSLPLKSILKKSISKESDDGFSDDSESNDNNRTVFTPKFDSTQIEQSTPKIQKNTNDNSKTRSRNRRSSSSSEPEEQFNSSKKKLDKQGIENLNKPSDSDSTSSEDKGLKKSKNKSQNSKRDDSSVSDGISAGHLYLKKFVSKGKHKDEKRRLESFMKLKPLNNEIISKNKPIESDSSDASNREVKKSKLHLKSDDSDYNTKKQLDAKVKRNSLPENKNKNKRAKTSESSSDFEAEASDSYDASNPEVKKSKSKLRLENDDSDYNTKKQLDVKGKRNSLSENKNKNKRAETSESSDSEAEASDSNDASNREVKKSKSKLRLENDDSDYNTKRQLDVKGKRNSLPENKNKNKRAETSESSSDSEAEASDSNDASNREVKKSKSQLRLENDDSDYNTKKQLDVKGKRKSLPENKNKNKRAETSESSSDSEAEASDSNDASNREVKKSKSKLRLKSDDSDYNTKKQLDVKRKLNSLPENKNKNKRAETGESSSDSEAEAQNELNRRKSKARTPAEKLLLQFETERDDLKKINVTDLDYSFPSNSPDYELFLAKIPKDLRGYLLKAKLSLTAITKINTEEGKLICVPSEVTEDKNEVHFFSQESGKLNIITTKLYGKLTGYQELETLPEMDVSEKKNCVALPKNLKQRHPLFGPNYTDKIELKEDIKHKLETFALLPMKVKSKKHKKDKHKKDLESKDQSYEHNELIFQMLGKSQEQMNDTRDKTGKKSKKKTTENVDILEYLNKNVFNSEPEEKKRKSKEHFLGSSMNNNDFDIDNIAEKKPKKKRKREKEYESDLINTIKEHKRLKMAESSEDEPTDGRGSSKVKHKKKRKS